MHSLHHFRQKELCRRPLEHVLNLTRLELTRNRRGKTSELPTFRPSQQSRSMKQVVNYDFKRLNG